MFLLVHEVSGFIICTLLTDSVCQFKKQFPFMIFLKISSSLLIFKMFKIFYFATLLKLYVDYNLKRIKCNLIYWEIISFEISSLYT